MNHPAVSGNSAAPAAERAERVLHQATVFAAPEARMLLCSEGLTTSLLQAIVRSPLLPRGQSVEIVAGTDVPARARSALAGDAQDRYLRRRLLLVTSSGVIASSNTVHVRCGTDPLVEELAADMTRPIGFALADAGVETQRHILDVGIAQWPAGSAHDECLSKFYALEDQGDPLMCIEELFNPDFVRPDHKPSTPLER
ncbi:hypothetical protein [Streptomyces sp. NPDC051561]|uniref:hypothetical protein n=1 Tax=Streptomyces sp. NPDC051561 TaxID=3365658 RepID=UPI003797389C